MQGVWSAQKGFTPQSTAVTIRGRIPVGLEEREGSALVKAMEEARDVRQKAQGAEKGRVGCMHILHPTQPKLLMFLVKVFQPVEESRIQTEAAADPGDRLTAGVKGKECLHQEFQRVLAVRDDEIRKDGMGMATTADHAHDTDLRAARFPFAEIKDITVIIGVDPAVSPASTAWADLQFRTKGSHITLETIFR